MTDSGHELRLTEAPVATTGMLIRRPAHDVFEAFVDPAITAQFWYSSGSARVEPGTTVQWTWAMYGFTLDVAVRAVEPDRRIEFEFPAGSGTVVEWLLTPHSADTTFVETTISGFQGDGDSVCAQAIGNTEGFTFVLAGLKAWLEHGVQLELVRDRHPGGLPQ